jgi:hypothetical protein
MSISMMTPRRAIQDQAPSITPRRAVAPRWQPVQTVIPVTTDPADFKANYGINSYFFAVEDVDAQSWANPIAALYTAMAVQAYQDGSSHLGVTPTALQLKRAMMSGVVYKYYSQPTYNDVRTITHNFVSGKSCWNGSSGFRWHHRFA